MCVLCLDRMKKKFDTDLKEEKSESMAVIQDLRARLESAEITLVQISSYRLGNEIIWCSYGTHN